MIVEITSKELILLIVLVLETKAMFKLYGAGVGVRCTHACTFILTHFRNFSSLNE